MGRIHQFLKVNGSECRAVFDDGVRNSLMCEFAVAAPKPTTLQQARSVSIAGRRHELRRACIVAAAIGETTFEFLAYLTDEIGLDDERQPIGVLIGSAAMRQWGIRFDIVQSKLDFTHVSDSVVEFSAA